MYDNQEANKRVLAFATQRNLELLQTSVVWFLDGIFKVSPTIFFFQLFTVMGRLVQNSPLATNRETYAFPFVYALLTSKEAVQYTSVLTAINATAERFRIDNCRLR